MARDPDTSTTSSTFPDAPVSSQLQQESWANRGNAPLDTRGANNEYSGSFYGEDGAWRPGENASPRQENTSAGENDLWDKTRPSSDLNDGNPDDYDAEDSDEDTVGANEDWQDMQRVVSTMFGRSRQAQSLEEMTRHAGIVWKNLTVRGVGAGSALQMTISDIFLALPRLMLNAVGGRFRKKPKPIKTILDGFTVNLYLLISLILAAI
jgi:hypothetical protein